MNDIPQVLLVGESTRGIVGAELLAPAGRDGLDVSQVCRRLGARTGPTVEALDVAGPVPEPEARVRAGGAP